MTSAMIGSANDQTEWVRSSEQEPGQELKIPRSFGSNPTTVRRTVRRAELRRIVPLADTTIYQLEQRGEFPRRFYLTSRCVVWDLGEVEAWIDSRRRASDAALIKRAPSPDVRQRKSRPVRQ